MNLNFTVPLWLGIIICLLYVLDKFTHIVGRKNFKPLFHKIIIMLFYKNNEELYKSKKCAKKADNSLKAQQLMIKEQKSKIGERKKLLENRNKKQDK